METKTTSAVVKIKPKTQLLTPEDLVEFRKTNVLASEKSTPTSLGANSNTESRDQKLALLYAELRKSISSPRVDRLCGRSLAIWEDGRCMARVVRKVGKFDIFGEALNRQFYLKYYETLYLLEKGRLQLDYQDRTLSIEQAYLLVLGEGTSKKYYEYLVYAYLTRTGYILREHQNKRFDEAIKESKEVACIWAWLLNNIEDKPVPNHIRNLKMYRDLKVKMETTKARFTIKREEDAISTSSTQNKSATNKRKLEENSGGPWQSKYACKCPESFLDFMKNEPEYEKFMGIFQKFDVIKMKTTRKTSDKNSNDDDSDVDMGSDDLTCSFDLYLHNNSFRKIFPHEPLMRVLVLPPDESFPSHRQLSVCIGKLLQPTPILIVSVGHSKQIQAFLYFMNCT